jgi:hypothetical protein
MKQQFADKFKNAGSNTGSSGTADTSALKALAKKKAEAAMQNPKRSPSSPLRGRPAGTVDTDMGMSKPKQPAPGGFGKGNSTPKRPDGTFRMS